MWSKVWERLTRQDDPWAKFFGVIVVLSYFVSAIAFYAVGSGAGDYDEATQDAVRTVSIAAIPVLVLIGLVMVFSLSGSWSPSGYFYAGALFQVLVMTSYLVEPGMRADQLAIVMVFVSAVCFALDSRGAANKLARAEVDRSSLQGELDTLARQLQADSGSVKG